MWKWLLLVGLVGCGTQVKRDNVRLQAELDQTQKELDAELNRLKPPGAQAQLADWGGTRGDKALAHWAPSHTTCEQNLEEAQSVIAGIRGTAAECLNEIDRRVEQFEQFRRKWEGPTIDWPYLAFAVTYADEMCKAKKACPVTGFSFDVCRMQVVKEMCFTDGINLCKEDKMIKLRKKEFLACLGQIATEWSCDYSRPMDMCKGQYIVRP